MTRGPIRGSLSHGPQSIPRESALFLTPMTFQTLSRLRSPSEGVPLGESLIYQEALRLVEGGAFQKADVVISKTSPALIRFYWEDVNLGEVVVQVAENLRQGSLRFAC